MRSVFFDAHYLCTSMMKNHRAVQSKKPCVKCDRSAILYKRCAVRLDTNQENYFANHKSVLKLKYQTKKAMSEFERMTDHMDRLRRSQRRSPRPEFLHPPMSSNCPFFMMRDDADLFLSTAKALLLVHDKFSPGAVGCRKYMRLMILKCHPDKFATSICPPRTTPDVPIWTQAVHHFSSTLINIANIESADPKYQDRIVSQRKEFFTCLEASRTIVREFEDWKQSPEGGTATAPPVEYERVLARWTDYLHCKTFDSFFDVWKCRL